MKNVKRLSVFFLGYDELEKDIAWNDVNELVTFIKDKGFIPICDPTGLEPTVVEFDLDKEISVDDALNLLKVIEKEGKYEATQFFYTTQKDDYYDKPPYARIYLHKI